MTQWDGIGDIEDWGEYYAGERSTPPVSKLDANQNRTAWEWCVAILKVNREREKRFRQNLEALNS